ncbi:MAG: hypothetical protein HS108_14415 [Planctomycetes bacterium]|nr:hypothetical protein [Planctomycetota bacterium]
MTWTDTTNPFTHPPEPDPENLTETAPASCCSSPYGAIVFSRRAHNQRWRNLGSLLLACASFVLAAFAWVNSLKGNGHPEPKVELDRAIADRRAYFDELYRVTNPEHIRNGDDLCRATRLFARWEREWNDHVQALKYTTALAGHAVVGLAHKDTNRPTREGKERKRQLQNLAAQAIKPPTPDSKIVLTTDEVIQLATTLIDAGWAKDINLAILLDERASLDETRNPNSAKEIWDFAERNALR